MRIAILCNDRIGLPALQMLVQNRLVVAAATSDRSPEMIAVMQQVQIQGGVPTKIFVRGNFETDLLAWLTEHKPDVVLVKTFPFRIPATALNQPRYGFINFHYAPLPAFRGSNPLFWMIRERVPMGGVSVHRMNERFDRGPILLQHEVPINGDDTFGMCVTQLAAVGAQLTVTLLQGLAANSLQAVPQSEESQQRWYGRPTQMDFHIAWLRMDAIAIKALAKACNPWMKGAHVQHQGRTFALTDVSIIDVAITESTLPGTIISLSREPGLVIACKGATAIRADVICTEEGYFPGEFMAKFGLKVGDRFQ